MNDSLQKEYVKHLDIEDIEFKDIVDEFCTEHDLVLIPLRKAHENTGNPLFRITASTKGIGGVIVYIKGDVVWVQNVKNKNEFSPQSLNHILTLVQKSSYQENVSYVIYTYILNIKSSFDHRMRFIKDVYSHLTSKSSYTYPEPSSTLISITSAESSEIENIEKLSGNTFRKSGENVAKNMSKSPMYFMFNHVGEMNTRIQDQNTGYSSYFGYERVIIKGDNDYYRWLQDYAKRDAFTDWVENAFGKFCTYFSGKAFIKSSQFLKVRV
ncbi:hypothetical protein PCK1_002092 [Pneumocystis canis]|nr:hypothetical protein PCK1_002092 [Pneumocystis canis]